MKHLLLLHLVILTLVGCSKTHSVPDPDPDPTTSQVGWIVGNTKDYDRAVILKTTDAGKTWHLQELNDNNSGFKFNLGYVKAFSDKVCWVMGDDELTKKPLIYKTEDGGITWKRQGESLDIYGGFTGIVTPDGRRLVAMVCGDGLSHTDHYTLLSDDGGESWTYRKTDVGEGFYYQSQAMTALADCSFIVSTGEAVNLTDPNVGPRVCLTSTDYGVTWKVTKIVEDSDQAGKLVLGLTIADKSIIYTSAEDIIKSTDGGNTFFTSLETPSMGHFNGLYAIDANRVCAVYDPANIMYTEDGGVKWHKASYPYEVQGIALIRVLFLQDGKTGFCTADNGNGSPKPIQGLILRTDDGGKNWTTAASFPDYGLWDISFVQVQRR